MSDTFEKLGGHHQKVLAVPLDLDEIKTLHVIEGGGERQTPPDRYKESIGTDSLIAPIKKEVFGEGLYSGRERRTERITLPSGKTLTTRVSEPHPEAIIDPENIVTTFIIRGFEEMSSAKGSTANRLHDEYALRRPGERTVSIDRYGYSAYDPPVLPWAALKIGLETDMEAVIDLLDGARHYASGGAVSLVSTSAGFQKAVEMAVHNQLAGGANKLAIEKEITGIVPCFVAKNVPESAQFRTDEGESSVRLKTTYNFMRHVAQDLIGSGLRNPTETIGCVSSIMGTLAMRPWLLPVLPTQFMRHMSGADFSLLVKVTENHTLKIIAAEKDALLDEAQYAAVEQINPGTVTHTTVPGKGHISLPIDVNQTLNAMGVTRVYSSSKPNLLQSGLHAIPAIQQIGSAAVRRLPGIHRLLPTQADKKAA